MLMLLMVTVATVTTVTAKMTGAVGVETGHASGRCIAIRGSMTTMGRSVVTAAVLLVLLLLLMLVMFAI